VGSVGVPEIIVILIVALVVLGPNRLPEAARQMGKAMAEFRRVTAGIQSEMRDALEPLTGDAGPQAVTPRPEPAQWVTPPLPVEGPDTPPAAPPATPAAAPSPVHGNGNGTGPSANGDRH
jgi:Tat protein translocase TatB subunit